jgi:hypothetical protein
MENFKLYNFIKLIVNLINKSNTRGNKMNKKKILSLTLGAFIIALLRLNSRLWLITKAKLQYV